MQHQDESRPDDPRGFEPDLPGSDEYGVSREPVNEDERYEIRHAQRVADVTAANRRRGTPSQRLIASITRKEIKRGELVAYREVRGVFWRGGRAEPDYAPLTVKKFEGLTASGRSVRVRSWLPGVQRWGEINRVEVPKVAETFRRATEDEIAAAGMGIHLYESGGAA
ncbi:MAG: hypothetical protein AAFP26_11080 [Planctomycetota bacterium]